MTDKTDSKEREAFEAFWAEERKCTWLASGCHKHRGEEPSIHWAEGSKEDAWRGWQARASLAANAGSEPVEPPPLQHFESPRAKILMRAWQEGWDACRDAEYVGEDAQNDAFNQSSTVNHCVAEDILYTHPSPPEGMVMVPLKATNSITCAIENEVDSQLVASAMDPRLMHRQDGSDVWDAAIAAVVAPPTSSADSRKGE